MLVGWMTVTVNQNQSFDSGTGSETSSDSDEIPDLIPLRVADQRFTRYEYNVILVGSNNDVSDLFC